jgi:transcriptional antiterminator NusG
MKWYVLQVRTGKEHAIKRELQRLGYEASAPIEIVYEHLNGKQISRLKTVIPSYTFVKLDLTDDDYYRITNVPNIIRFLGVGRPEPLPEEEEAFILWLDNDGTPLIPSELLIEVGQPAQVMSGPLKGREGLIVWMNRRQRRACVAVTIGGHRKELPLSLNVLKPPEGETENE